MKIDENLIVSFKKWPLEKTGSDLTVRVFENCNHNLQKCVTCAYQEDLSALNWQACDGYYETMEAWLRSHKVIE